tara:strand:+ start:891 stop:1604 length:714 start_codon:yes stop_codon:yes gene_type:complete
MQKISYKQIMDLDPCYDPGEVGMPKDYEASIVDFIVEYRSRVNSSSDIHWVLCRNEFLSNKELRLFAVWCARQVQRLMKDERSIKALDVAEKFANGKAGGSSLSAAWAAWAAARADADAAALSAAWAAAAARADADAAAWDADAAALAAAAAAWAADAAARADADAGAAARAVDAAAARAADAAADAWAAAARAADAAARADADADAAADAAGAAARAAQINRLIEIFKEKKIEQNH